MKTELCQFCLRSGILCPKCRRKVESGKVSQLDIEIGRFLLSLEEKYPSLQDVFFHKSIESGDVLAIFVGRGDIPRILSYGGKIIKALEQKTGKTVRILEYQSDERKFLEDLFAPMDILTINHIWLPDGTTETRVILKGKKKNMKYIEALKDIARKAKGLVLRIEFAT